MFKERIRLLRTQNNLTAKKLGEILNLDGTSITKWEQNGVFPNEKMLNKICDFFDVSLDYLLGRSEVKAVFMKEARWAEIVEIDNIKPFRDKSSRIVDMPKTVLNGFEETDYFITKVLDDAMLPLISQEDTLLVKKQNYSDGNDLVLLTVVGSAALVRRIITSDDHITLVSENPYYPYKKIADANEMKIFGIVKQVIKRF